MKILGKKKDSIYLYDDKYILYFGEWFDKTKVRLNLTRENFAKIDKESYTKLPSYDEVLKNWDKWKKQKEELEFDEFNTIVCPPGLKFEKQDNKLILSDEYCKRYQTMCLQNYDLNMNFINKLDKAKFNKVIDKVVKKYSMREIKNLEECKNMTGIYMAILDKYKQLYIGQTTRDLRFRILRHWIVKPKFDKILFGGVNKSVITYDSYGILDTTRIFIINETNKNKIDKIEEKLVKKIPKEYQTNRIGGGIHLNSDKDVLDAFNTINFRNFK